MLDRLAVFLASQRHAVRAWQRRDTKISLSPPVRSLIYVCNPFSLCGGHGDRTNGILTAFLIAILTSRAFFIDLDSPLPLNLLLQPRRGADGELLVDWRLHGGAVGHASQNFYLDDRVALQEDLGWLVRDPSAVVLVSPNLREVRALLEHPELKRRAQQLGLVTWPNLWAILWNLLFEPTPALRARLAETHQQLELGGPVPWEAAPLSSSGVLNRTGFIGIHFRAGNESARSWWDPGRHPISALPEFLQCAAQVEADLALPAATRWVLSADTAAVFSVAEVGNLQRQGKLAVLEDTRRATHVDRSGLAASFGGYLDSYTAYLLLASARAVVLSRSYFGETAAEIGSVPNAYIGEGCVPVDLRSS